MYVFTKAQPNPFLMLLHTAFCFQLYPLSSRALSWLLVVRARTLSCSWRWLNNLVQACDWVMEACVHALSTTQCGLQTARSLAAMETQLELAKKGPVILKQCSMLGGTYEKVPELLCILTKKKSIRCSGCLGTPHWPNHMIKCLRYHHKRLGSYFNKQAQCNLDQFPLTSVTVFLTSWFSFSRQIVGSTSHSHFQRSHLVVYSSSGTQTVVV